MADIICCDHHHHHHQIETTTSTTTTSSSAVISSSRRSRRMDNIVRRLKFVAESSSVLVPPPPPPPPPSPPVKRQKLLDMITTTPTPLILLKPCLDSSVPAPAPVVEQFDRCPKFSLTAVCGRRRDMEDAVAIHPSFWSSKDQDGQSSTRFHFFGLYDGHGCSHVAMNCRDRMHHLVKEELEKKTMMNNREEEEEWKETMERSFDRMDKEVVVQHNNITSIQSLSCRCELQMPHCDAVGSTAVVSIVTPEKVVVANCGDSRAILCRDGKALPLSVDHKPDLPEELNRIEDAGGRVIYWDGPRVLGVLAMSRAIGDNYLKPYVSSVPEITVTERTEEDEFLIMASDGLWDVVSNDTACGIVRMCLNGKSPMTMSPEKPSSPDKDGGNMFGEEKMMDKGCSDAAMLLTKLALARRSGDNVSVVVVDLRREKKKKN